MMYQGSKKLQKKYIHPIVLANRKPGQVYVEPFLGGANSFWEVANPRLGIELNPYVAALHKARAEQGWSPPALDMTPELYEKIKASPTEYDPALVGYVGSVCGFRAQWFGAYNDSYMRYPNGKESFRKKSGKLEKRNYVNKYIQAQSSVNKETSYLKGAEIIAGDYQSVAIPPASLIYCDPPYADTTGYGKSKFDTKAFWAWADQKIAEGHTVYVSEIAAPEGWRCVWERPTTTYMKNNAKTIEQRIERLFTK